MALTQWNIWVICSREATMNHNTISIKCIYMNGIGRFTVTSHAESRGRLRRLVGRREKLAAIYLVFTLYSSANKQFWWCRVLSRGVLVDVWIVRCHFTAFPRKRNDDNFGWMRSSANIRLRLQSTTTEFVDDISNFKFWTVLIISTKRY